MKRKVILLIGVLCLFIIHCIKDSSTELIFPEPEQTGTMTDQDGNMYKTVKIGNQWWMAENLKVIHYRNGDLILNNYGCYVNCVYDFDESYTDIYGCLYNWYAVKDSCNIAPEGWHVPTDEDWKELEIYLGMNHSEADKEGWRGTLEGSKLAGNGPLWIDGYMEYTTAFGLSGFDALPSGYYLTSYSGDFHSINRGAYFWTATDDSSDTSRAWIRYLSYNSSKSCRTNFPKPACIPVRLVKD